ncbi:MAG: hypothetical protein KDD14_17560, partial [Saprospiraceae bacterium]|nr:hypothetical protein [Saprospiraceae bacterium]
NITFLNDYEVKDVSFLAGFLGSSEDDDLKNNTLKTLLDKRLPAHHFLNIARFCSPNIEQLISWVNLFAKDGASLTPFQILAYGKVLNHLHISHVLKLSEKIASIGDENIYIALDIISSYLEIGDENWDTAKSTIKKLLSSKGFISKAEHFGGMIFLNLRKYISEFLKEGDEEFIHHLKNEVLDHITDSERLSYNSEIENILRTLINDHFKIVWDDIGNLILTNPQFYLMAKFNLGVRESTMYSEGALFSNPENLPLLFDWCRNNAPKAPQLIAGIMPTASKSENGDIEWHSFAKRIIDSFGDDDRLLNELHANFGSYSTWGSSVPYLESKLQLLELLKDHKIKRVRNWANDYIVEIRKSIQLEKIRDEEWGVK